MVAVNEEFTKQIESFNKEYPNIQKKTVSGYSYLKGILDIPDDEGNIVGAFSIEIHPSKDFPYAFPILTEVGGEIPCEADWHKYQDNSCCLTVPAKEKLLCSTPSIHLFKAHSETEKKTVLQDNRNNTIC